MHPSTHTSVAQIAAGSLFALALCTLLAIGLALLCLIFVNFLFKTIQRFKPNFGMPKQNDVDGVSPAQNREANKKVALDFLLQRRREAIQNAKAHLRQLHLEEMPAVGIGIEVEKNDWDLEALAAATMAKDLKRKPAAERSDLWSLVTFPHSPNRVAYYLITKLSQRGHGIRTAWAPLPQRKITMDRDSASRWAATLGDGVFVIPSNASARILLRAEQKREKEIENANTNAATA